MLTRAFVRSSPWHAPMRRSRWVAAASRAAPPWVALCGGLATVRSFQTTQFPQCLAQDLAKRPRVSMDELRARVEHDTAMRTTASHAHASRHALVRFLHWVLERSRDAIRALQLFAAFAPCIVTLPALLLLSDRPGLTAWWLAQLVRGLQRAGPTFIKLGQWASTRADIFSPEVRGALRVLHDDVGLEAWRLTQRTLSRSGADVLLDDVERKPLGAGCIAQVHAARLRDTGERVAVKIQRHGVRSVVLRDLSLMRRAVQVAHWLLPRALSSMLGLRETAELFAEFMVTQMDFNREALSLLRFAHNFGGDSKLQRALPVQFPDPVLVTPCGRVLAESLEPGETLSRLLQRPEQLTERARRRIGSVGVQAFLKMVLVDNFCHSDLHPGNILVRFAKNNGDDAPQLAGVTFLDAGLTTTLSEQDRLNFVDLFAAVATGNGRLAGQLMVERGDQERMRYCPDPEAFVRGIEAVVARVQMDSFRLDKVQIGSVLENVLSLVREYQVPVDPAFTNLILSIIVLEGIGRTLDPTLDIFKESLPILWQLDRTLKIAALRSLARQPGPRLWLDRHVCADPATVFYA